MTKRRRIPTLKIREKEMDGNLGTQKKVELDTPEKKGGMS